jgi:hypothetical protein
VFDFLLYVDMLINTFTIPNYPSSIVEIGSTVTTLQFSWSLNKLPVSPQISGPSIPVTVIAPGVTIASILTVPPLSPVVTGTSYSYQLAVSDGVQNKVANKAITFLNNLYTGDATVPGAINSAFVNTLAKTLQANKNKTYSCNAAGLQYAWYACRVALGTPTFVVNGFPGGFFLAAAAVAVTNSSGFVENYNVYRSVNPGIGPVTITVS